MNLLEEQTIIKKSIRTFLHCQGSPDGALTCKLNPLLVRRAWQLFRQEPESYTARVLLTDWSSITNNSEVTLDSIATYKQITLPEVKSTNKQQVVAKALDMVLKALPPSANKSKAAGKMNSTATAMFHKYIKTHKDASAEELFEAHIEALTKLDLDKVDTYYKKPTNIVIPNQGIVRQVAKAIIAKLKSEGVKIETRLAGKVNSLCWRELREDASKCTFENISSIIENNPLCIL